MEFDQLIKARYSCKKYSEKKVEAEKLEAVLKAGRLAPTAKNSQIQRVYVIQSEEGLAKVDKCTPCRYNAPVVLAVAFVKEEAYVLPGEKHNSGAQDASIVATHMMLAAKNVGLDSCWLNRLNPEEVAEELGIPQTEEVVMMMDLGYADEEKGGPLGNHFSRKDLSETVKYL